MRKVLVLLAATRVAAADPLGEFGDRISLRAPEQLKSGGCEYQLELRGAIVDGWLRERIDNPGPLALGAVDELTLPRGAHLIGAQLDRETAVAVPNPYSTEPASDAVGADPAVISLLEPYDGGHLRVRAIVSPFARSTTLALHFTAVADIRAAALRFTLPAATCRGTVKVTPGPGATVARLRVGSADTDGAFEMHGLETELVADLAYAKSLVWTQSEPLGDGFVARAQTVLAPVAPMHAARRVLVMIDGSRSMALVGSQAVEQVLAALGSALPASAEVEAVIFDRKPSRVFGTWKPGGAEANAAIADAVKRHVPSNGSDPIAAFSFAHNLLADAHGETMVITISDGAFGGLADNDLVQALGSTDAAIDLHAIVLDRGNLRAQSDDALRRAVAHYGGSYVEVSADELILALGDVDSWLRPATTIGGSIVLPGMGATQLSIARARTASSTAPIAQLALDEATATSLDPAAEGEALERADKQLAKLAARHSEASYQLAFAVLATHGTVARARHDAVAGGGPFTRTVITPDPKFLPEVRVRTAQSVSVSSVDKQVLETLFRLQLEPPAYVCYQRAIGLATLAGTVVFHFEISRGEVTRASVDGLGNAAFDSCLLEAAYQLVPPMPDPSYNADDRSIITYPLTFQIHEQKPIIVAGDADSSSPLDIDAVQGGAPRPRHITPVDTKTPLGNLRPTLAPQP